MTTPTSSISRPRGVSLVFALVTLAALSLAAVALVRSVNTSSLIVGNLGFKQDTIAYASRASEEAIAFLRLNVTTTNLDTDDENFAYYATTRENLDPANRRPAELTRTVVDWAGNGCATGYDAGSFTGGCLASLPSVSSANGNSTRYVITRLCPKQLPAADATNICARPVRATLSEGGEKGEINYNRPRDANLVEGGPYYRIVVRSVGARNTVSYTETLIHF